MARGLLAIILGAILVALSPGCGQPELVEIKITGMDLHSIPNGTSQRLTATGVYADRFTRDLTAEVTWISLDSTVANFAGAMSQPGLLTAVGRGKTTIRAELKEHVGVTQIEVSDAIITAVEVTPPNRLIAKGTGLQFSATGIFSDRSTRDITMQASWTTSDAAIAAFSAGMAGLAKGLEPGLVTVTATLSGKSGSVVMGVSNAELVHIGVTPPTATIAKGTTQQIVATGTFSDQTRQDITSLVSWTTMDDTVAQVSNEPGQRGLVTGLAKGSTRIIASLLGQTGSMPFSVTDATLVSISITPPAPLIPNGLNQSLVAIGTFSDGTTQDLTQSAMWASSDTTVATVSNAAGSQGVATSLAPGSTRITASQAGKSGSVVLGVKDASLVSIALTPVDPSIAKGTAQQLVATGTYSDRTTQDITSMVLWKTSDEAVAAVSNAAGSRGLVSSLATGEATIEGILAGKTGSTKLKVTNATLISIGLTPVSRVLAKGTSQQYSATGTYSDGSSQDLTTQVTWSSENMAATISNAAGSQGLASGAQKGTTTISASFGGKTGSTVLAVTDASLLAIEVTPTDPGIAKGTTQQLIATGTYSDGTTQDLSSLVSWTTSNAAVAAVSNAGGSRGLSTALARGSATMRATLGTISGSVTLTVSDATLQQIVVTPPTPVRSKGTAQQFVAIGTFSDRSSQDLTNQVTWESSNETVAEVSNAAGSQGLASGVDKGVATISASFGGLSGSTRLTVTEASLVLIEISPPVPTVAKGTTQQFVAVGTYSDGTNQDLSSLVTWSSSDPAVASISNAAGTRGLATAAQKGMADISASFAGKTRTITLTVSDAVLRSIQVTPTNPVLARGTSAQLVATGTFSDGTTQDLSSSVTWDSDNDNVARVSNAAGSEGLVTAVNKGAALISASVGALSGAVTLRVSDATLRTIDITPGTPMLAKGTQLQFVATGTYSDGSTQDLSSLVTWDSSDQTIATISNAAGTRGLAKALMKGSANITASFAGETGSVALTVSDAVLSSITVTAASNAIALGTTIQFTATGTFSDGTTQNLTTQVTWESSDPMVADISNADGTRGVATGLKKGMVTISATLDAHSGMRTLTITDATLASILVTPANPTVNNGQTVQLVATGVYSDGSKQDLTSTVTWSSSNMMVGTVSNAVGSKGLATSVGAGTAMLTASFGGKSDSTLLTVN